jgi:hypothetical protein
VLHGGATARPKRARPRLPGAGPFAWSSTSSFGHFCPFPPLVHGHPSFPAALVARRDLVVLVATAVRDLQLLSGRNDRHGPARQIVRPAFEKCLRSHSSSLATPPAPASRDDSGHGSAGGGPAGRRGNRAGQRDRGRDGRSGTREQGCRNPGARRRDRGGPGFGRQQPAGTQGGKTPGQEPHGGRGPGSGARRRVEGPVGRSPSRDAVFDRSGRRSPRKGKRLGRREIPVSGWPAPLRASSSAMPTPSRAPRTCVGRVVERAYRPSPAATGAPG